MNSNNAAAFFSELIFNFVILWRRIVRPYSKRESEVHEILFDRNSFILIVAVRSQLKWTTMQRVFFSCFHINGNLSLFVARLKGLNGSDSLLW